MPDRRPENALLAGVCARLAGLLGWNVWALRALFLLGLLIKALWVGIAYVIAACLLKVFGSDDRRRSDGLESPELAARNRRIRELEKRFRALD